MLRLKIEICVLVCFLSCVSCSFHNSEPSISGKSQNTPTPLTESSDNSENSQRDIQSNLDQILFSEKKNFRYQTKPRRKSIRFPADCQNLIGAEDEYQLERTCAAAIEAVLPDLPKENCSYQPYLEKNNLLDFTRYSTEYHPGAIKFYLLTGNNYLVEIQCWNSAYNVSNVYLHYNESEFPAKARVIEFPSYSFAEAESPNEPKNVKETTVKTVGGVYFNQKKQRTNHFCQRTRRW